MGLLSSSLKKKADKFPRALNIRKKAKKVEKFGKNLKEAGEILNKRRSTKRQERRDRINKNFNVLLKNSR